MAAVDWSRDRGNLFSFTPRQNDAGRFTIVGDLRDREREIDASTKDFQFKSCSETPGALTSRHAGKSVTSIRHLIFFSSWSRSVHEHRHSPLRSEKFIITSRNNFSNCYTNKLTANGFTLSLKSIKT